MTRTFFGALATSLAVALAGPAHAQTFPSKNITLVIPFPAGGVTDQVARTIAQKLQESLGKPAAPKRSALLPEVRTLAELGTPGVDASVWFGVVVKAGTPAPVVAKLNEEIVKALKNPDVAKRFADQGLEVMPMTPTQFGSFMKDEVGRWSALVKASGATVD